MSFLIIMIDGYDTLMIAFVAPLLAREWGLQASAIGAVFAIGYLGAIVGAVGMGLLADRLGRKPMLLAALSMASGATLLTAGATSLHALMGLRFITGVALGGALPAVMALTAEHAKPRYRNGTVTKMYIGFPMGGVIGGAATAAFIHYGWRTIFVGAGVACLLAVGLAMAIPESRTVRVPGATYSSRRMTLFSEQFAEGRLWPALMLWLSVFAMLVLTYFLVSWTPTLITQRGGSLELAAFAPVLLNLGGIAGALCMPPLLDRYGPYLPVACLFAIGSLLVPLLGQDLGSPIAILIVLAAVGCCIMGAQLNFPAMTIDLFPSHVRGTGAGWTIAIGRVGSILGPLVGGVLIAAKLGESELFAIAAIPALVAAAALFAAGRMRIRTITDNLILPASPSD